MNAQNLRLSPKWIFAFPVHLTFHLHSQSASVFEPVVREGGIRRASSGALWSKNPIDEISRFVRDFGAICFEEHGQFCSDSGLTDSRPVQQNGDLPVRQASMTIKSA
jgi:hypothetical protein